MMREFIIAAYLASAILFIISVFFQNVILFAIPVGVLALGIDYLGTKLENKQ